jgi:hypothetical protein
MLRQLQRDIYTSVARVQPIEAIEYGVEERLPATSADTNRRFVTLTSLRQSDVGCEPLQATPQRLEALQARLKWTCDPEAAVVLPETYFNGYLTTRATRAFHLRSDTTPSEALDALVDAPLNLTEPLAMAITLMWLLRQELDDDNEFDQQMHQAWITEDFVANTVLEYVFSCRQVVGVPCDKKKAITIAARTPNALIQWRGCTAFLGTPPQAIDGSLGQRHMLSLTDGRVAYFLPGKDVDVLAPHWGLQLVLHPYSKAETLLKHRSKTEFELRRTFPGPPFVATFKTGASHVQTYDPLAIVGIVSAEQLFIRSETTTSTAQSATQEVSLAPPPTQPETAAEPLPLSPTKTPPDALIEPEPRTHDAKKAALNQYFDDLASPKT